jgi:two-component system cell cycle sensor histidine kinase/response regulator CckA
MSADRPHPREAPASGTKHGEQPLRDAGALLSFALENSRSGIWQLNLLDHTSDRTLSHDRIFGYQTLLPDWTYEMFLEHVVPEDRQHVNRRFLEATATQARWEFECRIRRADGEMRWIWAVGDHWRGADGRASRMIGLVQDITERKRVEEELRQSEDKFRYVFDHSPIGKSFTLPSGEVRVNRAFSDMLGYSGDELQGKTWQQITHPDDVEGTQREVDALLAGDRATARFSKRYLKTDGSVVWADVSTSLRRDSAGSPAYFMTTVTDISDRVRAEEAARANARQLKSYLDSAGDAIYVIEIATGRIRGCNARACLDLGYSEEEILALSPSDIEVRLTAEEVFAIHQQLQPGEAKTIEGEHRRKDGSTFPVEIRLSGLGPARPELLIGMARDITERKRAERRLAYIGAAVEATRDAIGISDPQGHHVYQNKALSALFGYATAEELEAAGGGTAVVKDPAIGRDMFDAIMHGKSWAGELEMVTKSGRVFPAFERADAILDGSGRIVGLIGIITEMTAHRRAEEQRIQLETQLHQAQKMESVGRLAGGVAHDFNNMLGVILGHAELALGQVDPAQPLYADLQEIRTAANRSADLTRRLLAFARRQTVTPKVLDLNDTVASMLKMLRRMIGEDIDLVWNAAADLWPVKMDPSQVDQILANLCVNARDAISGVGRVAIETGNCVLDDVFCAAHAEVAAGDYVRLAVSDTGCGMEQEMLTHLFEPFFTTKGVGRGTGLGLATVYGAVRQNLGAIDVVSQPGVGTTFTIYLPRHAGLVDQSRGGDEAASAMRGHETILLVEDEPSILKVTRRMLERQGYTVLAASTAGEAEDLAMVQAGGVHLLITDVVMPDMDGRMLAQKLLSACPKLKCLFMSGYTADVIARHGVLDTGVHFIQKPFTSDALAAKVRETMDRR